MNKTIYGHRLEDIVKSEMVLIDKMNECYKYARDETDLQVKMRECFLSLTEFKNKVNQLLEDILKYIPDQPLENDQHKSDSGSWP